VLLWQAAIDNATLYEQHLAWKQEALREGVLKLVEGSFYTGSLYGEVSA
jgi:hypothetical protein